MWVSQSICWRWKSPRISDAVLKCLSQDSIHFGVLFVDFSQWSVDDWDIKWKFACIYLIVHIFHVLLGNIFTGLSYDATWSATLPSVFFIWSLLKNLNPSMLYSSLVQWLACLTMNPLARVQSWTRAVSAQLTQLFILPNGLVDKWVPRETWAR